MGHQAFGFHSWVPARHGIRCRESLLFAFRERAIGPLDVCRKENTHEF
jgi:hypothetical protein